MENFKNETSIQFTQGAYSILKNLPGSLVGTFTEFIDNSISSYEKNKNKLFELHGGKFVLKIEIDINSADDYICIRDNAAGINEKDFQRALQPANKPEDTEGLNEFGLGMKYAAVWLSNEWTLTSTSIDENVSRKTKFNYNEVTRNNLEKLPIELIPNTNKKNHGTCVELRDLEYKHVKNWQNRQIQEKLSSVYRNYLRPEGTFQSKFKKDSIIIKFNGENLIWEEFGFLKAKWWKDRLTSEHEPRIPELNTPLIEWKYEIKKQIIKYDATEKINGVDNVVNKVLTVSGFVGILPDGRQKGINGFVITRRGRVVEGALDERVFPIPICTKSSRDFKYIRIFGELNFEDVEVSFDKSKIKIPDNIRDICFQQIADSLRNIVFDERQDSRFNLMNQASNHRASKTSDKEAKKTTTKVSNDLNEKITAKKLDEINKIPALLEKDKEENIEEDESIDDLNIIPQTNIKKFIFSDQEWTFVLEWINPNGFYKLYDVKINHEQKKVVVNINMSSKVFKDNPKYLNNELFFEVLYCLALSELYCRNINITEIHLFREYFCEVFTKLNDRID